MPSGDGKLGSGLIGEKIAINHRNVTVTKLLGEGGFSYVYLCKDNSDGSTPSNPGGPGGDRVGRAVKSLAGSGRNSDEKVQLVLKVTSIHSRQQRDIAEKEAKLLSRLSHPSIIKMYDTCYRTVTTSSGVFLMGSKDNSSSGKPQHFILMEFCEGGHALDVCAQLASHGKRFDLSTLIIAFGQICNAVSYLHAQRPPIVHRDLKPVNFLVKNGAYKLCDFGSAVFGHVDLRTSKARQEAEEVIEKTTTQMFRAPEMVDLYSAKRLTQATDVWALGCCLYQLAFLQNCFEEGSNLAILSRKYKIPDDNPYGEGLVELLDRMLSVDCKLRSDMTEVILCLSAVYSGRPLPARKKSSSKSRSSTSVSKSERQGSGSNDGSDRQKGVEGGSSSSKKERKKERTGTYRTDGQGICSKRDALDVSSDKKRTESKKLNPNSAAARRRKQSQTVEVSNSSVDMDFNVAPFPSRFDDKNKVNQNLGFSTTDNFFASMDPPSVADSPDIQNSNCNDDNEKVSNDVFGEDVFGSLQSLKITAASKIHNNKESSNSISSNQMSISSTSGTGNGSTNNAIFAAAFDSTDAFVDMKASTNNINEKSDPHEFVTSFAALEDQNDSNNSQGEFNRGSRRSQSEAPKTIPPSSRGRGVSSSNSARRPRNDTIDQQFSNEDQPAGTSRSNQQQRYQQSQKPSRESIGNDDNADRNVQRSRSKKEERHHRSSRVSGNGDGQGHDRRYHNNKDDPSAQPKKSRSSRNLLQSS